MRKFIGIILCVVLLCEGIFLTANNKVEQTEYLTSISFSAVATAMNDHVYKGTAGYVLTTETRGNWRCGTTIICE